MKSHFFRWVAVLNIVLALAASAAPATIPNVEMIDQNGKKFQTHDLKGNYLLISWVFSTCPMPKMCPLTMQLNRTVQKEWKKIGDKQMPLRLLLVSLDPEEDTPAIMKKYGATHQMDVATTTLATGGAKVLSDFASSFNVAGWPSGGTTVHNLKTILVGPDLVEIKQYKDNEWQPEDVLKDLQALRLKRS